MLNLPCMEDSDFVSDLWENQTLLVIYLNLNDQVNLS